MISLQHKSPRQYYIRYTTTPNENTISEVLYFILEITAVTIDKECNSEMERIVLVEAEEEHVHITVEFQDGYRKYSGFPTKTSKWTKWGELLKQKTAKASL